MCIRCEARQILKKQFSAFDQSIKTCPKPIFSRTVFSGFYHGFIRPAEKTCEHWHYTAKNHRPTMYHKVTVGLTKQHNWKL